MREGFLEAAGVRVFVREAGEGSPVVLLHGFPQTGHCWRRIVPVLASRHRVIVPDLPGYGRSGPPRAYDASTLAATLAAAMEAAGAPRAAVVGHDWGGSLAFALAVGHPERVERLAVLNAPFRQLDLRRGWHFLAFNVPVLPEVVFALAGDRVIDFVHRRASVRKEAFDDGALEEYRAAFRSRAAQRHALAYYRTVTRAVILRRLRRRPPRRAPRRITAPTMIVWGMGDPALPPALLEGIARDIPHARIERLEGCGHFVAEECPERVARLLADFLAR